MPGITPWRKLAAQIADEIRKGVLETGHHFSSVQAVADSRGVSYSVAKLAFEALRSAGWIRPGSSARDGHYVLGVGVDLADPEVAMTIEERVARLERHLGLD